MATFPEADAALNAFISELSLAAQGAGWSVIRYSRGHSDRDFEARGEGRIVAFTAKISQTEKGFWGLTAAKAQELLDRQESLLLLNDASSGYFISTVVYARLLPKFSRTQEGAVRINEHVVRKEARFHGGDEAFEMLKVRG